MNFNNNLDKIKTVVCSTTERQELLEWLSNTQDTMQHIEITDESRFLISYLDGENKSILAWAGFSQTDFPWELNITLLEMIKRIKPKNFDEVLYLVTFYNMTAVPFSPCLRDPFEPVKFPPCPFLDGILSCSGGNLAYDWQMEAVYQALTDCSREQAVQFRKDYGKKLTYIELQTDIIKLPDQRSLMEALNERMVCWAVIPNYKAAIELYSLLFNIGDKAYS